MFSVSFVIPVYNKAPYLPAVLRGIEAQEGSFDREYIFVNDGSTDDSWSIVQDLTKQWRNVRLLSQSNHGSAHATNQGIRAATRSTIKFVDADDLLHPRATLNLLETLTLYPEACLAFGPREEVPDLQTLSFSAQTGSVTSQETALIKNPLCAAIRNSLFNPTQCLVRTEAAQNVGGCDERVVHSQEYSLTLRLARRAPFARCERVIAFIPAHVPGRLGSSQARQLRRVSLATALFMQDGHADLSQEVKRFAYRRLAGRAWKFVRRHRGASIFSPWFLQYLESQIPFGAPSPNQMMKTLRAFEDAP